MYGDKSFVMKHLHSSRAADYFALTKAMQSTRHIYTEWSAAFRQANTAWQRQRTIYTESTAAFGEIASEHFTNSSEN